MGNVEAIQASQIMLAIGLVVTAWFVIRTISQLWTSDFEPIQTFKYGLAILVADLLLLLSHTSLDGILIYLAPLAIWITYLFGDVIVDSADSNYPRQGEKMVGWLVTFWDCRYFDGSKELPNLKRWWPIWIRALGLGHFSSGLKVVHFKRSMGGDNKLSVKLVIRATKGISPRLYGKAVKFTVATVKTAMNETIQENHTREEILRILDRAVDEVEIKVPDGINIEMPRPKLGSIPEI